MTNFSSAEHLAAAAALGNAARLTVEEPTLDVRFAAAVAGSLAAQAAHHAHQAEREDERMAAVLMAQVSRGNGPELTDEELIRAGAAFKRCGHCGGEHLADRSCGCFDNGGQ
jgi:hypothetical protein